MTEVDGVGGSASRVLGVAVASAGPDRTAAVTARVYGDTATLAVRLSVAYPHRGLLAGLVALVLLVASVVVAISAIQLLTLAAILPGRATVLPLDSSGAADSGISRHSLRTTLRTAARNVDGVNATTLKLTRRTVRATVRTHRTNTASLADAVHAAIDHRLGDVGPAARPTIKVKVRAVRSTP